MLVEAASGVGLVMFMSPNVTVGDDTAVTDAPSAPPPWTCAPWPARDPVPGIPG